MCGAIIRKQYGKNRETCRLSYNTIAILVLAILCWPPVEKAVSNESGAAVEHQVCDHKAPVFSIAAKITQHEVEYVVNDAMRDQTVAGIAGLC